MLMLWWLIILAKVTNRYFCTGQSPIRRLWFLGSQISGVHTV